MTTGQQGHHRTEQVAHDMQQRGPGVEVLNEVGFGVVGGEVAASNTKATMEGYRSGLMAYLD